MAISIHAPREGSDGTDEILAVVYAISIHAPREGSDKAGSGGSPDIEDFNPRSPRGERRERHYSLNANDGFQSTLPARGATKVSDNKVLCNAISIHAPREGSDSGVLDSVQFALFQSTLPARGATGVGCNCINTGADFNPRSPRGERRPACSRWGWTSDFNPRSPRGERRYAFRYGQALS